MLEVLKMKTSMGTIYLLFENTGQEVLDVEITFQESKLKGLNCDPKQPVLFRLVRKDYHILKVKNLSV